MRKVHPHQKENVLFLLGKTFTCHCALKKIYLKNKFYDTMKEREELLYEKT